MFNIWWWMKLCEKNCLKKDILKVAKELSISNGISAINIRTVANMSNVSIGTVYNYYASKDDLILAIVSDFWKNAFSNIDFMSLDKYDFVESLEKVYYSLLEYISSFKNNLLAELIALNNSSKIKGRKTEQQYLKKISDIINHLLLQNPKITNIYTNEEITKLSIIIFDNILSMLKKGESDFSFFKKLLYKLLY